MQYGRKFGNGGKFSGLRNAFRGRRGEEGVKVTGAKTSSLTDEELREANRLYLRFKPFLRTEDFRAGFGGNEMYDNMKKFAEQDGIAFNPRIASYVASMAMDSDRVPVNRLNVDELEYSRPEKKLMMGNGGMVKRYEEGGEVDPPKFFIASGFDNRGDNPSGREIAAIFVRTPEGPKQIDPKDLLDMHPEAEGDIMKAYELAGINAERSGKGVTFPEMRGKYSRALMQEFGVDNYDALREKLNIARVPYVRERDLPNMVKGYDPRADM